jgi:hypothetical protein
VPELIAAIRKKQPPGQRAHERSVKPPTDVEKDIQQLVSIGATYG